MSSESETSGSAGLDATDILVAFWRNRLILVLAVLIAGLLGVIKLNRATYEYTADLVIYPTQPSNGLNQQFGGLAALAGVNVARGETSPFEIYSEELYSRALAADLSKNENLMRTIFRMDWDPTTLRWRAPSSGFNAQVKGIIKSALAIPVYPWRRPGPAELQDYIKQSVRYEEKPGKTTVTLSYDNEDPAFAISFLNQLHRAADERVRRATVQKLTQNIAYLNRRIQSNITQENKLALINVLSEQERLSMTASSDVAFSSETLGGASASPRPTKPIPIRVLVTYIFGGVLVGAAMVLIRFFGGNYLVAKLAGFRSRLHR